MEIVVEVVSQPPGVASWKRRGNQRVSREVAAGVFSTSRWINAKVFEKVVAKNASLDVGLFGRRHQGWATFVQQEPIRVGAAATAVGFRAGPHPASGRGRGQHRSHLAAKALPVVARVIDHRHGPYQAPAAAAVASTTATASATSPTTAALSASTAASTLVAVTAACWLLAGWQNYGLHLKLEPDMKKHEMCTIQRRIVARAKGHMPSC